MGHSNRVTRRDFVKVVSGVFGTIMGAGIAFPLIGYSLDPAIKSSGGKESWLQIGAVDDYEINVPATFSFTRTQINGWEKTSSTYGGFVVRKSETEFEVLSNICTHLGCRIAWHEDKQAYVCPCHDAVFDMDGNVVSGPPPRPLDNYEYKIEDGKLFIFFKEG